MDQHLVVMEGTVRTSTNGLLLFLFASFAKQHFVIQHTDIEGKKQNKTKQIDK